MAGRTLPTSFTVTRDCVIESNLYNRGDTVSAAEAAGFKKLNHLVARRVLLPDTELTAARVAQTKDYGFGDPPRDIGRPTSYSPAEIEEMAGG
jgi:hypothetical protein